MHNAKIKDIEDKIPDITYLATNATLNTKIKVKNEIASITNLITSFSLNSKINEVISMINLKKLNKKVTSNKWKHLLVKNELKIYKMK